MDPTKRFQYLLQRFEVFCRDVIDPAVYPLSYPLEVAAYQSSEPVPFAHALAASYSAVHTGWDWGPVWSTCWFRVRGSVPESMAGKTVAIRFSTDTEALLWKATPETPSKGTPLHGLDVNRDAVRLFEPSRGGEPVELYIEAACNHLFGDRGLQWDPPEVHRRWNSATPGRLDRCELVVVDETLWRLKWVYTFALQLAKELPHDSARAQELFAALRRATNAIPDDGVTQSAGAALVELEAVVRHPAGANATLCHAVGHAHIDTAWMWPIRETKRKCLRTFATALRNMERFPDYRFLCSQAQQYAWLEETSPELFTQVKQRVAEGRWEPGGAMWVEPDCNVPSGESLIRQILHADRYWRGKFGDARGQQRFLYLPDTFGFPAQLPQIMKLAGLDTFITNKLHWNDTNVFPHTTFIWRGLDGSEVLGHNTPGMDYNTTMTPRELMRGEVTHKNKTLSGTGLPPGGSMDGGSPPGSAAIQAQWLQPFGFGDGGGGPTDWNILNAQLAAESDGLPRVSLSTVEQFCDALHRDAAAARQRNPAGVPVHEGELYLELHRGTYTTHARIKQANAECEELLRQAEILTFAGPTRLPREEETQAKAELDRAWKLLLLNQFHDILPGSSIGWVYRDAERDYQEIRGIVNPIIERGMRLWAASLKVVDEQDPICYFNLANGAFGAFDVIDGQLLAIHTAKPLSIRVVDRSATASTWAAIPVAGNMLIRREGLRMEHSRLSIAFDPCGRIVGLSRRDESDREWRGDCVRVGADGAVEPLNQLVLYEDRPRLWDAWDFDAEHVEKARFVNDPCDVQILHDTPERVSIRFSRRFGNASTIAQTFTLLAHDCHVTVDTEIDWHEEHRLLRVLFPLASDAESVNVGTQFGYRRIATHPKTAAETAAFEIPFQRFIADPASGFSAVFPDRYGASVRDGTIGVSLLRSSRYPDPTADRGRHAFQYALSADPSFTLRGMQGDAIGRHRLTCPLPSAPASNGVPGWCVLECGMSVACMKRAENDDRLIVRLINGNCISKRCPVRWRFPVRKVEPVDLLEQPMELAGFQHDEEENMTVVSTRPFQIITLAITRGD